MSNLYDIEALLISALAMGACPATEKSIQTALRMIQVLMLEGRTVARAEGGEAAAMKHVSWQTWGNVIEALERAFLALGRAGANTTSSPYRDEWEKARAAIREASGMSPPVAAARDAQADNKVSE